MAQKLSSIPKKPLGVYAPLSLAQRRLWFLYQLDPQSPEYNISRAWRLKGPLNTEALATSLNLILARHETLRTTFQEIDGQPVQVIQPTLTAPFQERDCSSFSPAQLETEIDRFLIDEPLQPFDLLIGPLLRFNFIRCGPDDHVFIFTVHHMVFDGTSLKNFCQELSLCYQATLNGHPIPLAPLPIQYQDFAYWQQHRNDDHFTTHLEYWQQQLHGAPLVLELPSALTRPIKPTGIGQMQVFTIPPSALLRLKELIQPRGVTMFMALLAIFQILLARYTGQQDLLVGAPIAGRTHTDLEGLMGFFVNRLVLRGRFMRKTTFHDVLEQIRKTCLEAYSHQALPFEKLVEALQPNRDSSRYPVVQVIFQFRHASDLHLSFPKLLPQPFPVTKRTGNFDLHLVCEETEFGMDGFLYYPQDLFSDSMMANFAKHYQLLLEELLANPQRPIWQVPFLTEVECHKQLIDWNDTTTAYPQEVSLPHLFEALVAEQPDAVAVVLESQRLTYQELNRRANQLAHYLQRHGVGPEVRVGLCLDRSIEMIVAILGILKAGGAYVPLDPNYPQERLAFMAKDADLRVILTQEKFQAHLSQLGAEHIRLDADWPVIGQEEESTPVSEARADSLAYVIYTSGSTGRPKKVEVEHRQVVNYVDGILERLKLPAGSSFATVSPLTADLGNTMLYPALATGGTLHIISEDRATDPEALGAYFQQHQPDCLKIVPSHLATLLMGIAPAEVLPQKRLVVGGEACPWHLVEKVQALKPACWVINHYGPTETTVGVTTHKVEATKRANSHSLGVPIGRPLANSQLYLLDEHKNPVPLGVAGEMYIGGRGLARGYRDAPELTAEKFLPHPYSEEPGARLYKTGDRARFQPDGTIEFLGRSDHQVNLRGFRIELGEIESVLATHLQVPVVVGLYGDETGGTQRLVAYIGGEGRALPSVEEIKVFLKTTLPHYMIPANLVVLESLPMLPNGKVDRHALPDPEGVTDWETEFVGPRNLTEEIIASIWADVLQRERVSIHDNFFDLGGHSLLATQVVSRMRDAFGVNMKLGYFFEMPTIAGMAESIETLQWKTNAPLRVGEPSSPDRKRGTL